MDSFPTHPLLELTGWPDVLQQHKAADPADFALTQRAVYGQFTPLLAGQLHCYAKARRKLPGLHSGGWLYDKTALEQSSGEAAARYKASLHAGARMADLTGGLGIDTLLMSRRFETVHHVERSAEISFLARHNYRKARAQRLAGKGLRHHHSSAEAFLQAFEKRSEPPFDLLYIDPSRRQGHRRVYQLADCAPNVPALLPRLERCANAIMLKLSPLYDLSQLRRELPAVEWIQVISVRGEVKELLCGWRPGSDSDAITLTTAAVLLDDGGRVRTRVEAEDSARRRDSGYSLKALQELEAAVLAVPDAAVIKAGASDAAARTYGCRRISPQHDYLIGSGNSMPEYFPGTLYAIDRVMAYQPKKLKAYLRRENLRAVHLHKRQFDLPVEALYKKFGLEMGEQGHVFFTKDADGRACCIIARKL